MNILEWVTGTALIASSLGIILARKPVHAALCFLFTLMMLASIFMQLNAQFIAVMQILVYAGAILVIFMFVIILFQDAHQQIEKVSSKSSPLLLNLAALLFLASLIIVGSLITGLTPLANQVPDGFGSVQSIGKALYVDFFFPFEAVILIFLVAAVGAVYIGRKE